jgi:hypothetical protein
MAKTTKAAKAHELRRLTNKGPEIYLFGTRDFGDALDDVPLTRVQLDAITAHFAERYQIWRTSWVTPLLDDLLPDQKEA